ncbi:hypothetical protein GCM10025777_30560 [Membranihabitans marinus]
MFCSCNSENSKQNGSNTDTDSKVNYQNIVGQYKADIITDSNDPEILTMSKSANIKFTFNDDKTVVYEAKIMTNDIQTTGKFRLSNDSIFLYELGNVPDGYFKVTPLDQGKWQLNGSGNFILNPVN